MKRLRLIPLVIVPAAVLALAGCAGSGSSGGSSASASASASSAAISSCPKPGSSSKAIDVSGDFGGTTAPTVTFDKGLKATPPQATVRVKGTGAELSSGQYANVSYTVYQASNAKKLGSVGFDQGNPQVLSVGGTGFGALLQCARVGERLAIVGASDALGFGTSGQIVVVADVIGKTPTKSTGSPQQQDPSLPTVKDDKKTGEPQIAIPKGFAASSKTTTEVLKQGDGDTLSADDTVYVQYKGEVISTGKVFDSTWAKGAPASFALSGVVPGFKDGLVGQKVGSQVLIVIPSDQAYGANPQEGSGIPKNADLLFVVDILAKG